MRQELAGRIIGFGFRRTKELMLPVLEDALAWDVLQALGGERRLEQWAVFAVAGMTDEQVAAPLEACGGGNAELLGPEYARHNVHALLPWAWVYDALRAEGR